MEGLTVLSNTPSNLTRESGREVSRGNINRENEDGTGFQSILKSKDHYPIHGH